MAGRDASAAARRVLALVLVALLALAAPAGAAEPKASLPDIEDEVMCVECGTALNVSGSQVAEDEREYIRELIAQGKTKQQIKDALVAEYGPNVLAEPEDDGFGLAVYVVPPLLALLALAGVLLTARRWRTQPQAPAQPALGDEDARRLEKDMAAYEL
jgi:cytochrome c-type biogenesis protein CcmH/NrfF